MRDEKKTETKTDSGLAAKVRHLEEKIERMQENWRAFVKKFVGKNSDGKIGSASRQVMVFCATLALVIGVYHVFAGSRTIDVMQENSSSKVDAITYTTDDDGTIDVVQIGDYTLTGAFTQTGAFTGSGNIYSTSSTEGLHTRQIARATYDFAVDGGTTGAVTSLGVTIPDNAVIIGGYIDVTTGTLPLTTTFAIQLNTGNDIYAASTNLQDVGISAIVPVYTAATAVKTTNDMDLSWVTMVGNATQGVFEVVVEYDIMEN